MLTHIHTGVVDLQGQGSRGQEVCASLPVLPGAGEHYIYMYVCMYVCMYACVTLNPKPCTYVRARCM